jgi:hypothetical protein
MPFFVRNEAITATLRKEDRRRRQFDGGYFCASHGNFSMADTCDIPYADRTETEIEFAVEHDYGISDDPEDNWAEIPITRRLFKVVTVGGRDLGNGSIYKGGRISWSARW